jgi:hypothetical protein
LAGAAPPPPAKNPIARILIFPGCFVLSSGLVCKEPYLSFLAYQSRELENS